MRGNASQFSADVDKQIEVLPKNEYLCRVGRAKRLVEELYPLSRLALRFKHPGFEVEVEAYEDSGRGDGKIRISGFQEEHFKVEVTYAGYNHEDSLRNELLVSTGCCPGAGEISRDKKTKNIVAEVVCVDNDEHVLQIASSVMERFRYKVTKKYAPGTVLLIAFNHHLLYGQEYWSRLFAVLEERGGMSGSPFSKVYLFNGTTNELHRAS